MQTNDTLSLSDKAFADLKDQELRFKAKPKQFLSLDAQIDFNGCIVKLNDKSHTVTLRQKKQGEKLEMATNKQSYVQQRARGAYIATICQPKASFDLAAAAQASKPTKEEIARLNKRIIWQKENVTRGLNFILLDLSSMKLYAFVDASFANNKDMLSQMGYVIALGNKLKDSDRSFKLTGNIIY
jgi:hypothetical protein